MKQIACIGTGLIGLGWATHFAVRDLDVRLYDIETGSLGMALKEIEKNLAFLDTHDMLDGSSRQAARDRIRPVSDLKEAIGEADYIQESVPDRLELKQEVFRDLDRAAPPDAIIASSSSGLLMSEIQTVTKHPERCVLAHPFLPVHLMPLVEVVGGQLTAEETVSACFDLMRSLGKTPVRLKKEVPGYIVNRLQAALLREAFDLVLNDVADAGDVDKAFCCGSGLRDPFIGPILRAHLAGDGIEQFLERYEQSYRNRWSTMAQWHKFPEGMREKVVSGVHEMPSVNSQSTEDLRSWRDEQLVRLLSIIRDSQ